MKKMLYISNVGKNTNYVGVWKKIQMQIDFFESNGIEVTYKPLRENNDSLLKKILIRLPFYSLYSKKSYDHNFNKYHYIYIRKSKVDYRFITYLKKIKQVNPSIKILMELPTFPYDKEENINILNLPIIIKDRFSREKLNKYVDKIITYSNDDEIFGIPTIKVSNVIDFSKITQKKHFENNKAINLIAVANFSFWHGYDRVIEGMKKYYESNNKIKIALHLVGNGKELEKYKDLVSKYNLTKQVTFYGKKEGEELEEIYNFSHIALDAMGRHRVGVKYNSTLKGKEYGAKGLPIVSGVETELDDFVKFKYYLRIPANDSPVNMKRIIKFYNEVYSNTKQDYEIENEIRRFNIEQFDINNNWKSIIQYLNKSVY